MLRDQQTDADIDLETPDAMILPGRAAPHEDVPQENASRPGDDRDTTLQRDRRIAANSAARAAHPGRIRVIVADPRAFMRGCLGCWLNECAAEFLPVPVSTLADTASLGATHAAAAILSAPGTADGQAWLRDQFDWLRAHGDAMPVILIQDGDPKEMGDEPAATPGLQGVIPMSGSPHVAAAALRLIIAGGNYFPAPPPSPPKAPPHPRPERLPHLTPRERAVIDLLTLGLPNKLIAYQLGLSLSTVKIHVHHIIDKLTVHNRTEVAIWGRAGTVARMAATPGARV